MTSPTEKQFHYFEKDFDIQLFKGLTVTSPSQSLQGLIKPLVFVNFAGI